jgi:hypothetical protein
MNEAHQRTLQSKGNVQNYATIWISHHDDKSRKPDTNENTPCDRNHLNSHGQETFALLTVFYISTFLHGFVK